MQNLILTLFTFHNLLLFWGLFLIYRYYKTKKIPWGFAAPFLLVFVLASTHYVPARLMQSLEWEQPQQLPEQPEDTLYVHVFGAGYALDERLAPTAQLNHATLARLVEGVRLMQLYPNAILVTSGRSDYGVKSQAEVGRDAAITLGIAPERIRVLTSPHNTRTEIEAFVAMFGAEVKVIAVSDAKHLPRIRYLYGRYPKLQSYYAPTNYRIKEGINSSKGLRFPSLGSLDILNEFLVEWGKTVNERRR